MQRKGGAQRSIASGSTRSPWIEILFRAVGVNDNACRAPHGARGLKWVLFLGFSFFIYVGLHTEPVD